MKSSLADRLRLQPPVEQRRAPFSPVLYLTVLRSSFRSVLARICPRGNDFTEYPPTNLVTKIHNLSGIVCPDS
jgi:hypothetical protein